jgi:tRNA pseudouridine38-40 synthase
MPRPPRSSTPRSASGRGPNTYRLLIEYDGSRFAGWQDQQNARSIVGELKKALTDSGLDILDLGGAGRTDAGVHALGQVAHLRLDRSLDPTALEHALNDRLPAGIHVLKVMPAAARFHARHDAVSRAYLYQLSRRRSALAKPFIWWIRSELDVAAMEKALALLPGRHDFRLFAAADDTDRSTLVEIERVELREVGDLILIRLVASHFLWRMVRRLVGTIVQLGLGRIELEDFERLLIGQTIAQGSPAEWTAPASGLFLESIRYPGDPLPGLPTPATPVG